MLLTNISICCLPLWLAYVSHYQQLCHIRSNKMSFMYTQWHCKRKLASAAVWCLYCRINIEKLQLFFCITNHYLYFLLSLTECCFFFYDLSQYFEGIRFFTWNSPYIFVHTFGTKKIFLAFTVPLNFTKLYLAA